METKNIPTIIMLAAAFVTSIVMYINDYELNITLKMILIVFLVFYILGFWVKKLFDRFCQLKVEEEDEEENTEEKEESDGEKTNEDGSVIEKK